MSGLVAKNHTPKKGYVGVYKYRGMEKKMETTLVSRFLGFRANNTPPVPLNKEYSGIYDEGVGGFCSLGEGIAL